MTGAATVILAMGAGKAAAKGIHEYLSNETQKARAIRALNNTLNTPDAKRLNNDDKTLFWAKL